MKLLKWSLWNWSFLSWSLLNCGLLSFLLLLGCVQLQPGRVEQFIPSESKSEDIQVVHHQNYLLGYHEESEQAAWVLYELLASELSGERWKRTDDFRTDPSVLSGSADLSDYRGSGYDRGHLAPAADMAFSKEAMSESFYLSNMSPQEPGFNRGIWRGLEALVRGWALKYQRIIIVTAGVVTGADQELNQELNIGENQVLVPNYYYKIVYDPQRQVMIAFLLENNASDRDLFHFIVSVDQVEDLTGLDFFPRLPNAKRMEAEVAELEEWSFE